MWICTAVTMPQAAPAHTICFHDLGFKLIVSKVSQVSLTFNRNACKIVYPFLRWNICPRYMQNACIFIFSSAHIHHLSFLSRCIYAYFSSQSHSFSLFTVHRSFGWLFIFRIRLSFHPSLHSSTCIRYRKRNEMNVGEIDQSICIYWCLCLIQHSENKTTGDWIEMT